MERVTTLPIQGESNSHVTVIAYPLPLPAGSDKPVGSYDDVNLVVGGGLHLRASRDGEHWFECRIDHDALVSTRGQAATKDDTVARQWEVILAHVFFGVTVRSDLQWYETKAAAFDYDDDDDDDDNVEVSVIVTEESGTGGSRKLGELDFDPVSDDNAKSLPNHAQLVKVLAESLRQSERQVARLNADVLTKTQHAEQMVQAKETFEKEVMGKLALLLNEKKDDYQTRLDELERRYEGHLAEHLEHNEVNDNKRSRDIEEDDDQEEEEDAVVVSRDESDHDDFDMMSDAAAMTTDDEEESLN